MHTRRNFIGKVATGLGGIATGSVLGANAQLRVGIVGYGERGAQLAREIAASPDTEIVAVADVYQRRLDEAKQLGPAVSVHRDYRSLLEVPGLDTVFIATPPHLHSQPFIAALEGGKHVYVERTAAFGIDDARRMRAARNAAPRCVVQAGHQTCSSGQVRDALNFLASGRVGKVSAIRAQMFRNTPRGKPQWTRPVYPDMTPENISWTEFLGGAREREFDANRFVNWRLFQEYSGGAVQEHLSQQMAFWYKVMNLEIPAAVTMTGGVYLWKDGREVPDTMNVSMDHAVSDLLFTWNCGFGNSHPGVSEDVLGTDGTISRSQQIRYTPQKMNLPGGAEALGQTPTAPRAHVQNFFDSIRNGTEPNCPFETAYRVSVACRMAMESYHLRRTVYWDFDREEMV
jgi:predicted dehydrogenase